MNQPKNTWLLAVVCLLAALCLMAAVAALQMWPAAAEQTAAEGPAVPAALAR